MANQPWNVRFVVKSLPIQAACIDTGKYTAEISLTNVHIVKGNLSKIWKICIFRKSLNISQKSIQYLATMPWKYILQNVFVLYIFFCFQEVYSKVQYEAAHKNPQNWTSVGPKAKLSIVQEGSSCKSEFFLQEFLPWRSSSFGYV